MLVPWLSFYNNPHYLHIIGNPDEARSLAWMEMLHIQAEGLFKVWATFHLFAFMLQNVVLYEFCS
jgi:hypothetical protein